MNSEQDGFSLLLWAVVLFQLPTPAISRWVTSPSATPTLVGMLVDQGRMRWDEPVEAYLPKFKLAGGEEGAKGTRHARDVLSHCTPQLFTAAGRRK